jgi:drug/metabolite transporter (DMT)-like permease
MNSAIPFYFLSYSTLYVTAGFAAILNATAPLWAALVAWIWLSGRLDSSRVSGLLIGFAGVLVLVWNKLSFDVGGESLAIFAALGGALFYGIGANFAKRYVSELSSLSIATGSMISAAVILSPSAVIFWPADPITTKAWGSVIVMGIASTGLAYILYFRLIANVGPANAITVTFLVPAFAVIWGALFLNEAVTMTMLAGCIVILIGTALATGMLSLKRKSDSGQ